MRELVTKMLILLHLQEDGEKVEEVRKAFLMRTGQQSVLRVSYPVSISF